MSSSLSGLTVRSKTHRCLLYLRLVELLGCGDIPDSLSEHCVREHLVQAPQCSSRDRAVAQLPQRGGIQPRHPPLQLDRRHWGEGASWEVSFHLYRFCKICNIRMPRKSHHCRDCDVCIADFDHHCPWTSKCIGGNNLKRFYFFVSRFVMI